MTKVIRNLDFIKKCFIFMAITHVIAAIYSSGHHHFDEHFQILEFLNYKLGATKASELAWEFHNLMRSWVQPGIYFIITKILNIFSIHNPFVLSAIFRLLTSFVGLYSLILLYRCSKIWFQGRKSLQNLTLLLLSICWFIPFIHARVSGENLGASLFIIGMSLITIYRDSNRGVSWKISIISGILFGLSFMVRFQMGIMVATYMLWLLVINRLSFKSIITISLFIIITSGLGIIVDYWGYGEWTITPWNYLYRNIIKGAVSTFGVTPWWDYFRLMLFRGIPPVSFPLIICALWVFIKNPKHLLTWTVLPFFIVHSYIGHKELRFIFVVVLLSPLLFVLFLDTLSNWREIWRRKWVRVISYNIIGINCVVLLISIFQPANRSMGLYSYLYKHQEISEVNYLDEEPYTMVSLPIKFYRSKALKTTKIASIDGFKNGWLFATKGDQFNKFYNDSNCKLHYMTYPKWLLSFNIGNWVSRSRVWSLFYCQKN
jgi:phosphatidylinositol glycan class B